MGLGLLKTGLTTDFPSVGGKKKRHCYDCCEIQVMVKFSEVVLKHSAHFVCVSMHLVCMHVHFHSGEKEKHASFQSTEKKKCFKKARIKHDNAEVTENSSNIKCFKTAA